MRQSTAVGRLLVCCLVEHDWTAPLDDAGRQAAALDAGHLAAAARYHGVTGCVLRSVGPRGGGRPAALEADHRAALDRHLRTLGDLARLAPALDAAGVGWVVVKGPVLAEALYARSDLRSYNDLDLLVAGRDLAPALSAVERAGGRLIQRNWPLLRELQPGELLLRLHHGTLLDLHWHLVNDAATRHAFTLPMGEILRRARPVSVAGIDAMTLDPIDTVLHLGLHGTLSGGNRLVWLKDIERAIVVGTPAWQEVADRARAWGIGPPVALALARARRLLGAPVPPALPAALAGGRAWLAVARTADRLTPPERSTGDRSPTRLVSRSTRRTTASSAAELGRHMAKAVAGPHRFSRTPPVPDADPAGPGSAHHAAGTAADRQAFLDRAGGDDGA